MNEVATADGYNEQTLVPADLGEGERLREVNHSTGVVLRLARSSATKTGRYETESRDAGSPPFPRMGTIASPPAAGSVPASSCTWLLFRSSASLPLRGQAWADPRARGHSP